MCFGLAAGVDDTESSSSSHATKEIDRLLRAEERLRAKEAKILLLGAAAGGKSTILKQMRLIYMQGFSMTERKYWRVAIYSNILSGMRQIFEHLMDQAIGLHDPDALTVDLENNLHEMHEIGYDQDFPIQILEPLNRLWQDPSVQQAVLQGNQFGLPDNLDYLYNNIDRYFQSGFIPTDQDILRCRQKTTGISETIFSLGELTTRMFDVGGQLSERRKWIHCFEAVTAVLFVVALNGYDMVTDDDYETNQMQEALALFESICNSVWFQKTSMILFLNKIDLFESKLAKSPVTNYYPEFTNDPTSFTEVSLFFRQKFVGLNRSPQKDVYVHFTNATDTTLLKKVMLSVQDTILQTNLRNLML